MTNTQGERWMAAWDESTLRDRGKGWGIVCIGQEGRATPYSLFDGAIVGRSSSHDGVIDLEDSTLSQQHAQFLVRSDGVYVSDLDTPGGTRVDGVPANMLGIAHGSVLRMGETLAMFVEKEIDSYTGQPQMLGEEMLVGSRQRPWVDEAIESIRRGKSFIVQGGAGVGKATLARVALRMARVDLPIEQFEGSRFDPDHLIRSYDSAGPSTWLITHLDRIPRAVQADIVRAIQASPGSLLIGTLTGLLDDAQAEGRVGSSLLGLIEGRLLRVPNLEDRREDIAALSLEMLRRVGTTPGTETTNVFECVMRAGWPGGVRELGAHLAAAFDAGGTGREAIRLLSRTVPRSSPKLPLPLQESDVDLARTRLGKALTSASGTVAVAARELRMSRQAFYRELRRLGIDANKTGRGVID